ncbi:MAG TPA: VanZ family protein [Gemmatimonadales bacterium]|nr:VanZ family protein [Gemmatimonadales bacterium]
MPSSRPRLLRALPAAVAIGLIALLTLEPRPRQAHLSASTPWHCLVCGGLGTVDVILNIGLFLPFGFALYRLGFGAARSALMGLALSSAVELLQATVVAGRDPSLSDLLTNTTGSLLGALLAHAWPRLARPDPGLAGRLTLGGAILWLAMLGFTGWAVQPDIPSEGLTLRQTPIVPNLDRFPGSIRFLMLNGRIRGAGRLDEPLIPDSGEPVTLVAEGTLLSWPEVTAPIADIVDDEWNTVAMLGQLGQKVTFSVRARAESVKLRTPSAKVYRALPSPSGQPIGAGGRLDGNSLTAFATFDGTWHTAETRLTPGLGWMLILPLGFYPFDYRPEITSAIWTALPLLLLGYWTRKSATRPLVATLVWAGLAGTGLLVIPPLTGAAGQGWETATACAIALLLGWFLAGYASAGRSATVPPSARSAASP